eukprot:gene22577-29234_t
MNETIDTILNDEIDIETNEVESSNQPSTKRSKGEIRKPYSAWTYFSTERRLQIEKSSGTFAEIAKQISEEYKKLSNVEKQKYIDLATQDKIRYKKEIEAVGSSISNHDKDRGLPIDEVIIPMGRVKKIIKLDPEVKALGREAVAAITKATDEFVVLLSKKSLLSAKSRGNTVKTIRDTDIINCIHMNDLFEFLRLDFPRKPLGVSTEHKIKRNVNPNVKTKINEGSDISSYFLTNQSKDSVNALDVKENNQAIITDGITTDLNIDSTL